MKATPTPAPDGKPTTAEAGVDQRIADSQATVTLTSARQSETEGVTALAWSGSTGSLAGDTAVDVDGVELLPSSALCPKT